jgi:hypothetical protein
MGVIRFLVLLYPKKWRRSFGEEFAALLEDTRLTPGVIFDAMIQAGTLQVKVHRRATLAIASLAWSAGFEYISVHARLTANILWAPTNLERGLALLATIGPWLALTGAVIRRRDGAPRRAVAHNTNP